MSRKQTYEELIDEIKRLEQQLLENRQMANLLQESNARCRLLFDNSLFLISYISTAGIIISINKAFAKKLGGEPSHFIGKSILESFPHLAGELMEKVQEVITTGTGQVYNSFIELPSKNYWFKTELQPIRNNKDQIFGVQVVAQDITRRKKTEEQVEIFKKIAERSEQSFGMMDLEGNITYNNPSLCHHLGAASPLDALGINMGTYYSDDHHIKFINEILPTVMEHGHWTGELDFISAGGKRTNTIQHIFLIRDKAQKPFFIADIVTDITAQHRLNEFSRQKERLETLGAIAAEVAHEIRNPLVSIGGFARRLKSKFSDTYECDIILKESQRLEKILSRIRNYLDPVELHPQECRVDKIIKECLSSLDSELKTKKITYSFNLPNNLPSVYADQQILSQIFMSLIRNEAGTINYSGHLSIRSFENFQDIQVEFINHSPNYRRKYEDSMFIPFGDNHGYVGLPLCYRLLKDMGGILSFSQKTDTAVYTVSIPKNNQTKNKSATVTPLKVVPSR